MKMYVAGQWIDKDQKIEVRNSYDNSLIDTVPRADRGDIERALQSAERGARAMAKLTSYERWKILHRAADLLAARGEELGTLISKEEGKILAEGRAEALRAVDTIMESAEEAKRVHGETVALDAASHGKGKFGVTIRVPCGVVVAISPFNFPLNLVCHKVGPAIAGGNAVIVKPATDTPLSALRLTEILLEAGLPPEGINILTGSGGEIGDALVGDRRVRKITFTGSRDVGEHICKTAGIKRVTMELGSNAPVIVMPDADLDKVAAAVGLAIERLAAPANISGDSKEFQNVRGHQRPPIHRPVRNPIDLGTGRRRHCRAGRSLLRAVVSEDGRRAYALYGRRTPAIKYLAR